jgi:hypothetical protein
VNRSTIRKLAPWSAIVYVALEVGATTAVPFDFMDEPAELAAAFTDDSGRVLLAGQLLVLAGAFLLWFSGTLASAIRVNGGGERLASMARTGGTAAAALLFAAGAIASIGGVRAEEDTGISPDQAAVHADIGIGLAAAAAPAAMSVLVGATAAASLMGSRFIPWQLDWVSVVVAIALVILPINFIAVLAFFAWSLLMGGLMIAGRLRYEEIAT